jgi:hypothetical protein
MLVTLAEELFRKGRNSTGTMRCKTGDGTGISSALRKGRVSKHFGFTDNMALVSYVPKKVDPDIHRDLWQ